MIKTVAIVSLSSGTLGEPYVAFEVEIGLRRLEDLGLEVRFMPGARKGATYLSEHPEARAQDLLDAFADPTIDLILSAIGGDDTYRLLPYLFEHDELARVARDVVFLGFSDTTINHLMLNRLGLRSFYGQAFLPDVCELESDMLPYTRTYFEELIATGTIFEVRPSDVWYESRKDFGEDQVGAPLTSHPNQGFELLQGPPTFSGKILGGCIDTFYDLFSPDRYRDMPELCARYRLFPDAGEWKGRILLLESSEEFMEPARYRKALGYLKDAGVFDAVSGVLVGKPMDEVYAAEYKDALVSVIDDPALAIVCNVNVGHALPRAIIPFGVEAYVDATEQVIRFPSA